MSADDRRERVRPAGKTLPRRIVGNLDCESDFEALAWHREAGGKALGIGPLPQQVLTTIAGAATLLRAFAREGDRLWLPAAVAPEAMAEVPGLPLPRLETGPLEALEPTPATLAWGETKAVSRLRRRGTERPPPREDLEIPEPASEGAWQLPIPTPEAAARVNDRRFCTQLAEVLSCRLPGSRVLTSQQELSAHLAATGLEHWVLKAPFSAAGRRRLVHQGGTISDQIRRRVDRLFARHGELVFEPWMERTLDVGCAAIATPDGPKGISLHRLIVDRFGRFRGLEMVAGENLDSPWLQPGERARLEQALEGVAAALQKQGYSGPFGIDAWRYLGEDGVEAFHPLGEINGRLTFGWLTRSLVDRLLDPLGIPLGCRVRLVFGSPQEHRDGARIVPLLHPLESGDPTIRLEIMES